MSVGSLPLLPLSREIGLLEAPWLVPDARDMDINGSTLAYASFSADTLEVFDVTDPEEPVHTATRDITTGFSGVSSILAHGNGFILIGFVPLVNGVIHFEAWDTSDSSNPILEGSLTDSSLVGNASFRGAHIDGDNLYVIYGQDSSSPTNSQKLFIIDISDHTDLSILGTLNDVTNFRNPYDIIYTAGFLWVYTVPNSSTPNVKRVDVSNPAAITVLSTTVLTGTTTLRRSYGVVRFGNLIVYSVAGSPLSLRSINVSTPSSPTVGPSTTWVSPSYEPFGIDNQVNGNPIVIGSHLYVGERRTIRAYNTSLTLVGSDVDLDHEEGFPAPSIAINNSYFYFGGIEVVSLIDISTPTSPTFTAIDILWHPLHRIGVGSWRADGIGVWSSHHGMAVVDASDPTNPVLLGGARKYDWIGPGANSLSNVGIGLAPDADVALLCCSIGGAFASTYAVCVDFSTPSNPVILSRASLGTPPVNSSVYSAVIMVPGGIGYIMYNDSLKVIDCTNPSAIFVTASVAITNTTSTAAHFSEFFIRGNYLYVGAHTYHRLRTFDISTPDAPVLTSEINAGGLGLESMALVNDHIFYLFRPNIRIYSLATPATPVEVYSGTSTVFTPTFWPYDINGIRYSRSAGKLLGSMGNVGGFASPHTLRASGSFSGWGNKMQQFGAGAAGPITPSPVDTAIFAIGQDFEVAIRFLRVEGSPPPPELDLQIGDSITNTALDASRSIEISGNYAFIASDDNLVSIDISNPTSIEIAHVLTDSMLDHAYDVAISGNYAFVVQETGNTIVAVDISDPTNMTIVGSLTNALLDGARGVALSGSHAFVAAAFTDSLVAINISTPSAMTISHSITGTSLNGAASVAIVNNYAFVASTVADSLTSINISNPSAMTITGSITHAALNGAINIAVSDTGTTAFVSCYSGDTVASINISNPSAMTIQHSVTDSGWLNGAVGVTVSGYTFVAANLSDSLVVMDTSNPSAMTITGTISHSVLNGAHDVAISGDYAYVACYDGQLVAIKLYS